MSTQSPSGLPSRPGRLPWFVLAIAVVAATLHLLPQLAAAVTVPAGWHTTGIHQTSPDVMQYRVWFRQAQIEGPIISNTLTAEPHRPYMVVLFAWAIGTVASWTGMSPEWVYVYAGCLFAFLWVIVLYRLVETFFESPSQRLWVLAALLLGGGLGGHIKLWLRFDAVRNLPGVKTLIAAPLEEWQLFENYRGHFAISTLFDTHFLLVWLCVSAAGLLLHRCIAQPTTARLAAGAVLALFTGVVHLHSGLSIVVIAMGMAWMCWLGKQQVRESLVALVVIGGPALAGVAMQAVLVAARGLPSSPWRALPIEPSILFLAYTLQWIVGTWALIRLWKQPTLATCTLTGWLVGCLVYTFSGPFWLYPDRGTLTLVIPLTILAGLGYFATTSRPSLRAVVVTAFFMLATPVWTTAFFVSTSSFNPNFHSKFVTPAHDEVVATARRVAKAGDLLLADEDSLLWLAPEYPGVHYCAHFFLTLDYEAKQARVTQFYLANAAEQSAFLREQQVRFLWVPQRHHPERFAEVPGLTLVVQNDIGALYSHAQ